jgi:hypothetical protein
MKKRLTLAFNLFAVVLLAFALYLNFVKEESNTTPLTPTHKHVAPSADIDESDADNKG